MGHGLYNMNDSSTTVKEAEENDVAEGGTWQAMVVVVAVLGTLVGVVVVVGGVWVFVICSRRLGRRNERGQEDAFPPIQRDVVDLGCVPTSLPNNRLDLPPDANNNYSGISKGLGLGVSYPAEQIPSLPTPWSWTPSPPFDSQQNQIPPQRFHVSESEGGTNSAVAWGTGERGREALYGSRARTSPYNPRYNTLATDYCPHTPSIHTLSSSYRTHLKPRIWKNTTHEQWETLGDPYYRKCSKSPLRMTYRRPPRHQTHEELGEGERRWYQNTRTYLHKPSKNTRDIREGSDGEPPAACSSCHGTPHHHPPPSISRSTSHHVNPSRMSLPNDFRSDLLQESRTGSEVESDYRQEGHSPAARCKRKSKLWVAREGKTRAPLPTPRPHWMKHYQASVDHDLWQPQQQHCSPPPTAPHNQQDPHVEHDRVVARRLALKYGFCPTCVVQKSLKQRLRIPGCAPYGNQQKSRHTQTEWDNLNSSVDSNLDLTHDPTPSMSWDNLTPDPSPVLTNTPEAVADVAEAHDVSSHAGAHVDCFSLGATADGFTYPGEINSSNGE